MYTSANPPMYHPHKKHNVNISTPSNSQIATCKLFVGNLATHTTGAHLQAIFHSYGQVIECVKVRERYGFVRFASSEESQRALMACNGLQLNGYPMIVEYAQNEILISPMSPRTNPNGAAATYRPHPYHVGRSNINYHADSKLTTPITVNTTHRHATVHHSNTNNNRDDIPLLSAAIQNSNETNKYATSTLNPDASSFTFTFSPSNHYQQSRINNQKNSNHDNTCSTSDYYSQSGLPSSGSSSVRSAASLSPSILSAISPSMLLQNESPTDESISCRRSNSSNLNEKRQSTNSSLNFYVGDKILSLYGPSSSNATNSNSSMTTDLNNNHNNSFNINLQTSLNNSNQFDNRDIDPRDPIFIWNFAFYPDVSISPFVKRADIKTLLERRVSLYSR